MVSSHPMKHAAPSLGSSGGGNTAKIVSHPRRLCGLIAKIQATGQLFAQQKQNAVANIENLISRAATTRTEDNASQVDWIINEYRSVMKEIQALDPLKLPNPDKFSEIAKRLQQTSVGFMYSNSSAFLNGKGWGKK